MSAKHWSMATFIITQERHGNAYGYCMGCHGDMQILGDKKLRHYHSHRYHRARFALKKRGLVHFGSYEIMEVKP